MYQLNFWIVLTKSYGRWSIWLVQQRNFVVSIKYFVQFKQIFTYEYIQENNFFGYNNFFADCDCQN